MNTLDRPTQARAILDATSYMVLGTADADGRPWVTPVWFASDDYREFFWVSSPDATHSRNIGARPEIGIVVFDSSVPIGTGQGVYMHATAGLVDDGDIGRGLAVFSARSLAQGGRRFERTDLEQPDEMRLYRAVARDYSMLAKDGRPDYRVAVDLGSGGADVDGR